MCDAVLCACCLLPTGEAVDWLARVTAQGAHPEWFVEQMNCAFGKGGYCLNLVNVSEPLKVARLILGVDDTRLAEVRLVPRLVGAITTVENSDARRQCLRLEDRRRCAGFHDCRQDIRFFRGDRLAIPREVRQSSGSNRWLTTGR